MRARAGRAFVRKEEVELESVVVDAGRADLDAALARRATSDLSRLGCVSRQSLYHLLQVSGRPLHPLVLVSV